VWDGSSFGITQLSFPSNQTGSWYFVAGWHDAANDELGLQVFDGSTNPVATMAHATGVHIANVPFEVGRFGTSNTYCWNGVIDEIGIWTRVLTPAERTQLWNSGAGLVYPFLVSL
jgi:hypothetical protein